MGILPPPHLLKINGISTSLPCQKCTSLYTFGSEFRQSRNIASNITSGIHAASDNPQRISTAMDGGGSKLQQVFRQKNLSLDSVYGCTLSNMPAGIFCALLVSASPIYDLGGALYQKRYGCRRYPPQKEIL